MMLPDSEPPQFNVVWWETVERLWKRERVMKAEQFWSYEEAFDFYKIQKAKQR